MKYPEANLVVLMCHDMTTLIMKLELKSLWVYSLFAN